MKLRTQGLLASIIVLSGIFSCQKDQIQQQYKAITRIEITDAPIDDTNIKAVYVTITGIKMDGQAIENFTPVTIDLKSLQNGKTKLLSEQEMNISNYSNISLMLDYDKDVNGVSPGTYVLDEYGKKHALNSSNSDIQMNYNFAGTANQTTNLIIDFDLRKSIVRANSSDDSYDFPEHSQLSSALRVFEKDKTGTIMGNARNITNANKGGKTYVFAYRVGDYNAGSELYPRGTSKIEFANAVTSAQLDAQGNFKIIFLEEGDYQLEFAYFEKDKSGEKYVFQGTYQKSYLTTFPGNAIKVKANDVYNVDLFLTGLQLF